MLKLVSEQKSSSVLRYGKKLSSVLRSIRRRLRLGKTKNFKLAERLHKAGLTELNKISVTRMRITAREKQLVSLYIEIENTIYRGRDLTPRLKLVYSEPADMLEIMRRRARSA